MPSLVQGRIVYSTIPIPDPQGRNAKQGRPFVVITKNIDIDPDGFVDIVGITNEIDPSLKDKYVLLPWGPHARTCLTKKSAALCSWLVSISAKNLIVESCYLGPEYVLAIVEKVKYLHRKD